MWFLQIFRSGKSLLQWKKIKKLSNTVAFFSLWRGVNYIYGLGHLRSLPVKLMYCHSNSRPRMWGPFWECTFLPFFIGEKDISVYLKSTHSQTDTVTQFSEKSIMALQLRHVSKREKRRIYFSSLCFNLITHFIFIF